jgi:hypothetical protein
MLRPGNVHSADGVLDFIGPIVKRYRAKFRLFWLRGDAAFADSEGYKYCEREQVTYFIRLPGNEILKKLARAAPAGGPSSQVGGQGVGLPLRARSWDKPRGVVCKVQWHTGELFPRVGYIVTNSTMTSWAVVKTYNGRGEVENRIKEGKNTLRWDKTGSTPSRRV